MKSSKYRFFASVHILQILHDYFSHALARCNINLIPMTQSFEEAAAYLKYLIQKNWLYIYECPNVIENDRYYHSNVVTPRCHVEYRESNESLYAEVFKV